MPLPPFFFHTISCSCLPFLISCVFMFLQFFLLFHPSLSTFLSLTSSISFKCFSSSELCFFSYLILPLHPFISLISACLHSLCLFFSISCFLSSPPLLLSPPLSSQPVCLVSPPAAGCLSSARSRASPLSR